MLRFKNSESYGIAIKNYGRIRRNWMDRLCGDSLNDYTCKDLPAELKKQGIETTAEQCRNQSAVIVGHYADELQRECLRFAQEVSDWKDPKIVIQSLEEFYIDLIRKMESELNTRFGQYSDRYYLQLTQFVMLCMYHSPDNTIPGACDRRNERLNALPSNNFFEEWRAIFKNSDWTEAAILRRIDGGLSKALIYDVLRQSDGDLDRAARLAASVVYEEFFVDILADEMRAVALDSLEPNDDLETLLGTVKDVVTGEFFELADSIEQLVKDLAEQMRHELNSELM